MDETCVLSREGRMFLRGVSFSDAAQRGAGPGDM